VESIGRGNPPAGVYASGSDSHAFEQQLRRRRQPAWRRSGSWLRCSRDADAYAAPMLTRQRSGRRSRDRHAAIQAAITEPARRQIGRW